jgi:hypothetical protein
MTFDGHGKIHLANWDMVCMQKEHGGLRVPNLRDLNMVLLGSWIKRYLKGENKLWYEIVKEKYTRNAVNIFCLPHAPSSQFWKGIIWAVKALKFGYRWQIGDGVKIRFWEDIWFRNSPLAVQFWDLYCICDQIGKSIAEVWNEQEVKLTFRTFSQTMWERWLELVEVVSSMRYTSDGDALIWAYESRGEYTIKSLYAVINFRGVQPVFVPAVWEIVVPPRIQVFLWLLANNKVMTVDNLLRRGTAKPLECQFCKENESVQHLFFNCVVAKYVWNLAFMFTGVKIDDYLSLASKWLDEKKFGAVNSIAAGILWGIWLSEITVAGHQDGAPENLDLHDGMDTKMVLRRIRQ